MTAALTGTWGWPVVRALAVAGAVPELDYDDAVELLLLIEAVGRITEALNGQGRAGLHTRRRC